MTSWILQLIVRGAGWVIMPPVVIGTFLYSLELAEGFAFSGPAALVVTFVVSTPVALVLTLAQERLGTSQSRTSDST